MPRVTRDNQSRFLSRSRVRRVNAASRFLYLLLILSILRVRGVISGENVEKADRPTRNPVARAQSMILKSIYRVFEINLLIAHVLVELSKLNKKFLHHFATNRVNNFELFVKKD